MEAHTKTLIHIHIQIPINTISNTIQTQSSLCHSPISLVRSVFTHIGVNVHTHMLTHTYKHTHAHIHAHTNTHTQNTHTHTHRAREGDIDREKEHGSEH